VTGFEPVQPFFRKSMMACDFWQNAQQITRVSFVPQSSTVLAEPDGSASFVETFWRRPDTQFNFQRSPNPTRNHSRSTVRQSAVGLSLTSDLTPPQVGFTHSTQRTRGVPALDGRHD